MAEPEYTVRPDVRVVVHDANTVELRTGVWNSNLVTLADDEQRDILADLVVGIVGGEPLSELQQRIGASGNDVSSVLETLVNNDILALGKALPGWSLTSLATNRTVGMNASARHAPERLRLVAPGRLADLFRGALTPPQRQAVTAVPVETWQQLRTNDLVLDNDAYTQVESFAPFEDWQGQAVVAVLPSLEPILLANLNRIAHHVDALLLPAVVDGPFGIIGPMVVPGITACFQCAETRVLDAMRDHTLYVNYRTALAAGRVHHADETAAHPFDAVIASFAAWETANVLAHGSGFTAGKLLTIYAPTMELSFHELLRVPNCPVCGHDAALDAPLYADLRAYLTHEIAYEERQ